MKWLVLIAVLIAVLIPTGCTPTSTNPSATPSPDLLYYNDPNTPGTLIAIDWYGVRHGKLSEAGDSIQAPDGNRLLSTDHFAVTDSRGVGIGTIGPIANSRDVTWADDSRHVCVLSGYSSVMLFLESPGSPNQQFTLPMPQAPATNAPPSLAACSIRSERAVVTYDSLYQTTNGAKVVITNDVVAVDLTTGALVYQHSFVSSRGLSPVFVTASPDAQYLAEDDLKGNVRLMKIPSEQPTASFNRVSALGFSWNDRYLVLRFGPSLDQTEVADLKNHTVAWKASIQTDWILPRTGSTDQMVLAEEVPGAGLTLLRFDGTATHALVTDVYAKRPCPCPGAGA